MQANDQNGNSINYLLHIQKMYEEQQQLELEHSRLRQQLNDHVILPQRNDSQCSNENNNGTVDDIRIQLDCEKAQSKSLKKEVVYLLEQVRRTQKRYNDLISIVKNDKERPIGNDLIDHTNKENLLKLSKLESENKDLKENNEFVSSENAVLADSLKDLEETLHQERGKILKEKDSHEELLVHSRILEEKSKERVTKIENLEEQLDSCQAFLSLIHESFIEINKSKGDDPVFKELNNLENTDLQSKLKLYRKVIADGIFKNIRSENALENESSLSATPDNSLKATIIDLTQQLEVLTTDNRCLFKQNEDLKQMLEKENIDGDQVKLMMEISNLKAKLAQQEETNGKLIQKYARNRKVWEDNEKKVTAEIGKMDNFIAVLVDTLKKLPDNLKNCPELQELLVIIDQSELEKATLSV